MARQKAVTQAVKKRRGRPPTRSANVAEEPEAMGPAMSPPPTDEKASPAKRTPRKAAARGKWSEEKLLTSNKSVLIHEDLVKLLSKPEAWNFLEEDEKREILALLPADIHPDADLSIEDPNYRIPPLPSSFVRYSTNWREGIRVFQHDLENGRYDPEWLRQAENARRERERGDFDSFKEREFEEFWGQKQRMDMAAAAGEPGRIKLRELVEAGVILPGDVWRYSYAFGKGESRILIDKEARVHEINGSLLSFVVPTGQRTLLTSVHGEVPDGAVQGTRDPDQPTEAKEEDVKTTLEVDNAHEGAEPAPQEVTSEADESNATSLQEAVTVPGQATTAQAQENCDNGPQDSNSILTENPLATSAPTEDIEMRESGENKPQMPMASPDNSPPDSKSTVQVLIMSPSVNRKSEGEGAKRAMSPPASEPPVKRKRGRPPKHPTQPKPEPEIETKPQPEPDLETEAEPKPESPSQPELAATQLGANLNPSISQPGEIPMTTGLTDDATAQMDSTTTGKEADQIDLSSPPSEPPDDQLSSLSEPESQSQSQSQPRLKRSLQIAPYGSNEVIITGIKTPNNLATTLFHIDGRPKEGQRSANAWKEIRCYRKNQDMGSLFEVRQTWYYKQKLNEKDEELEWEG